MKFKGSRKIEKKYCFMATSLCCDPCYIFALVLRKFCVMNYKDLTLRPYIGNMTLFTSNSQNSLRLTC